MISDGMTPLMLASFCGVGLDCSADDDSSSGSSSCREAEGSRAIINELLSQGAAINAQTDRTGRPV